MRTALSIILLFIFTVFSFGQPNVNLIGRLHNEKGIYKNNGKYGFVNYDGKINYLYDSICPPTTDNYLFALKGEHWGAVDLENNVIIPFEYEQIQETINKNQLGQDTFIVQKNGLLGIVDFRNKIVIPIKYDAFSGLCGINIKGHYVSKNSKTGIIDNTGNMIIPIEYDSLYYYSKEIIKANLNGKYGVINSQNEIIIPLEYDALTINMDPDRFDNVCINKIATIKGNSIYFFDTDGKMTREFNYGSGFLTKLNSMDNISDLKYIKACMIIKK